MMEQRTEIATAGSASRKRKSRSQERDNRANDEYIEELKAEIARLKYESGRVSKYPMHQR